MPFPLTPGSLEDLEDLFENAPCGYLSLHPDGRIIRSNRTFSTWIGTPSEQLIGKRLRDLLNVAGRMFYETHFAPLLRMQGFFNEVALDVVTANGKTIPMLANAKERRDADGNLVFTRVTLFAAAERRRYERELVEAQAAAEAARLQLATLNEELEKRVAEALAQRLAAERGLTETEVSLTEERTTGELREQFIAVLGHDLRNPVAAINAATRILLREPQSERATQIISLMQGSVVRIATLIDNVLDFARGRLGGGLPLVRDADKPLTPVLRQVVDEVMSAHPGRVIEVDFQIDEPVQSDRGRIAQLASNLLGNAVAHGLADQPIRIKAATIGDTFELWVANAGSPIPEAAMERLFQPFFRGAVRKSQQGLGLGLYIVSEIAHAHGGDISVESSGNETRFTFRMPKLVT
jgi:sigma-B regulation protein RsbU (phosphoserine phosphatase)